MFDNHSRVYCTVCTESDFRWESNDSLIPGMVDLNQTTGTAGGSTFLDALYTYVVPVLYGLVSVVGVVGNCLVIYVILAKERMRTVTNLLLLNLAFADLSFVLVIPPFTAYQFAAASWPFGDPQCRLMHYLVNVTAYVTVYTMVLISVIRYMTIVHTLSTARVRTRRSVVLMILAIWVIMLGVNVPVMLSYSAKHVPDGTMECDIISLEVGQRLFATFFTFAYLLPLAVIAMFSVGILHHIMRHKSTSVVKSKTADKKKQVGRMLILVVVVFAILWLPVHVHLLVAFFGQMPDSPIYGAVSILWNCMAYFNSCVNPIIYNHTSKEFRDAFREVAACKFGRTGHPVNGDSHRGGKAGPTDDQASRSPGRERLEMRRFNRGAGDGGSSQVDMLHSGSYNAGSSYELTKSSLLTPMTDRSVTDGFHLTVSQSSQGGLTVPTVLRPKLAGEQNV